MIDFRQVYRVPTAVVEYLQITGSVQHIVNIFIDYRQLDRNVSKTLAGEQRFLEGSRGPVGQHHGFLHRDNTDLTHFIHFFIGVSIFFGIVIHRK